jgi:hypothetical protein
VCARVNECVVTCAQAPACGHVLLSALRGKCFPIHVERATCVRAPEQSLMHLDHASANRFMPVHVCACFREPVLACACLCLPGHACACIMLVVTDARAVRAYTFEFACVRTCARCSGTTVRRMGVVVHVRRHARVSMRAPVMHRPMYCKAGARGHGELSRPDIARARRAA